MTFRDGTSTDELAIGLQRGRISPHDVPPIRVFDVRDFRERPEQWENTSLEAYLGAMAAWVQDMDGYYRKCGEKIPKHLTWKNLGEMLSAARIYE